MCRVHAMYTEKPEQGTGSPATRLAHDAGLPRGYQELK